MSLGLYVILYLVFAMLPLWLGLLVFQLEPSLLEGDTQHALLAPSSILAENFIKPLFLREVSDQSLLRASRLSVVLMAQVATGLTFFSDSIYDLVAESSVLGAVSILVPMLYALFGRKPSATGALLSMSLGLAGYIVIEYVITGFQVPALFIGMAGMLVGSLSIELTSQPEA